MLKRIYMDRATIARNKKEGRFDPAICVRTTQGTHRGHDIIIDGLSRVLQMEEPNPLAAGATVWIQTTARVSIVTKKEDGDEDYVRLA